MNLSSNLVRKISAEFAAHLSEGRCLSQATGEDGRLPLTLAQHWRYGAQHLLHRALNEEHPAFAAFEKSCYHRLADRSRFLLAVDHFEDASRVAIEYGIPAWLGFVRSLLEPYSLVAEERIKAQANGALWHALLGIALMGGLRSRNEYPSSQQLIGRLTKQGLLCGELFYPDESASPEQIVQVTRALLAVLVQQNV